MTRLAKFTLLSTLLSLSIAAGCRTRPTPKPKPIFRTLARTPSPFPSAARDTLEDSLTAMGSYGKYLSGAMANRWHQLLQKRNKQTSLDSGRVVISFRIHQDGHISQLKTLSTEVGNHQTMICEMAIRDPAPFPRWLEELLSRYPKGFHDVTVTFIYRG